MGSVRSGRSKEGQLAGDSLGGVNGWHEDQGGHEELIGCRRDQGGTRRSKMEPG